MQWNFIDPRIGGDSFEIVSRFHQPVIQFQVMFAIWLVLGMLLVFITEPKARRP
jgi:hypothetical protein